MWLLLLEAFLAMMVLVFIVWWTMFSGRPPESPGHTSSADNTRHRPDDTDRP